MKFIKPAEGSKTVWPIFTYKQFDDTNPHCLHVIFSDRAYAAITAEALAKGPNETGMVLLGCVIRRVWYVAECIPAGHRATHTVDEFRMDVPLVNYLLKSQARLYRRPMVMMGFWHRHPGSMDYFSVTDFINMRDNLRKAPQGLISGLVNLDPELRLTLYYARGSELMRVNYDHGDEYFPDGLLDMAGAKMLLERSGSYCPGVVDHQMLDPMTFRELTGGLNNAEYYQKDKPSSPGLEETAYVLEEKAHQEPTEAPCAEISSGFISEEDLTGPKPPEENAHQGTTEAPCAETSSGFIPEEDLISPNPPEEKQCPVTETEKACPEMTEHPCTEAVRLLVTPDLTGPELYSDPRSRVLLDRTEERREAIGNLIFCQTIRTMIQESEHDQRRKHV